MSEPAHAAMMSGCRLARVAAWACAALLVGCYEQHGAPTPLERGGPRGAIDRDGDAATARACSGASCFTEPALDGLNPLDPARQSMQRRGDSAASVNSGEPASCASLGPDVAYDLDLRAFTEPVPLQLALRAGFDASLRVERGTLEDPALVACNEDHAPGVDDAFLAVTLAPDRYRVVVDGEQASGSGEFELTLTLLARESRCRAAPENDRCEQATVIDTARSRQTFVGTTDCASDQAHPPWECADFAARRGEVFYSLDLSGETEPQLVHVSADLEPKNDDVVLYVVRDAGGYCAETLTCNGSTPGSPELWAKLLPGRYLIGVESGEAVSGDFGLLVELSGSCAASNDSCATAQDIAPELGTQTLTAWPLCGDDSIRTRCGILTPSPDIFYRLDLTRFSAPVRVTAAATLAGAELDTLVLMSDAAGTCGNELWCGNFDLWLEPGVYRLALDAYRDQQGPVDLRVTLSVDAPPATATCIDEAVAVCARQYDCCSGDDDQCWLAYQSCGLSREALDCLCAADPACCEGRGSGADCGALLADCGTFCPGFDPALTCPP